MLWLRWPHTLQFNNFRTFHCQKTVSPNKSNAALRPQRQTFKLHNNNQKFHIIMSHVIATFDFPTLCPLKEWHTHRLCSPTPKEWGADCAKCKRYKLHKSVIPTQDPVLQTE